MDVCTRCGDQLGVGRFCTNCGQPVGEPVTREQPLDDATPATPPPTRGHRHVAEGHRRGAAAWLPWVAGLTAMLLVAALGLWLLLGERDRPTATAPASDSAGDAPSTEQPSRDPRTPEGRRTVSPAPVVEPQDLAGAAAVRAPRSAPPARDIGGNEVGFAAGNLLDGVPETCWRMPGDGTGESITFTFDQPTELSEVGLVNGYAKTAQDGQGPLDWYAGNRRTLRVEWTFDDGTLVEQDLQETRTMQTVPVENVVAEQVTLRLIEVTSPGQGRASRDYTAISDVRLFGAPA